MKKFWTMLLMMFCITCLTGCIRFNASVNVKTNGKADLAMLYAVTSEFTENASEEMIISQEDIAKFKEEGWEVTDYNEEGFMGFKLVKSDVDLVSLSDELEGESADEMFNSGSLIVNKKGFDYVIDWDVLNGEDMSEMAAYKKYFDMSGGYLSLTVNLPYPPKECNATSISEDGKTLTWNLLEMNQGDTIHVAFSLLNIKMIMITAAVAAIILIGIIIAVVLIIAGNKKKQVYPQQMQNGYMQGQMNPGQNPVQNQGMNPGQGNYSAPGNMAQGQGNYSAQGNMAQGQPNPNAANMNQSPNIDQSAMVADEIAKLQKLMTDGVISKEEFEEQKKKLLGK